MLDNDVDALLEAESRGTQVPGHSRMVKSNKAFQIVKEEDIHFE